MASERPPLGRPYPGTRRGPAPDPADVVTRYQEGKTEAEIARILGISRSHVRDILAAAGQPRRSSALACPVDPDQLRALVENGETQARLAERFEVSSGTMGRWLAEAGIGDPDSRIDHPTLRRLYVEQQLTVREVGAQFGVSHHRVIRELALAGIKRRSRHTRRPRHNRAAVTKERLQELYINRGLTLKQTSDELGVSTTYLTNELRRHQLAKRPGTFRSPLTTLRTELADRAAQTTPGPTPSRADRHPTQPHLTLGRTSRDQPPSTTAREATPTDR